MLNRVLVANRGEIARRIFRTCHALGLSTVAVHSDADSGAPHVRDADAAVLLPGRAAADTYLRSDLIIAAARTAGADAVHPGYGFLAENAEFARAVLAAGLTWIGPPPEVIAAMGSKTTAKALVAAAGVPVLAELDPADVTADKLPVLVKAAAGGGGRGMRVVRSLADLPGALESASAEAASAFGDPAVFCERYVERGRHIEVQIVADAAGTMWTVGERECSIQRRHQKIIEEAPSPLVSRMPQMRGRLFEAARSAAAAVGYRSAGTVEFLADEGGGFWFLEMNTRLQVEHPVTECVTGLDLVALQLQIAAGRSLPPEPPPVRGHAIEARLYAEDPAAGWRPHSGTVHEFTLERVDAQFCTSAAPAGLRLDSGVAAGSEVSAFYDPMLAKVIAWAPDREQAAAALARALRRSRIHGPVTNRDALVRLLRHPAFLAGQTDTAFFDTHGLDVLAAPLADADAVRISAVAAALATAADRQQRARVLGGLPIGWRNVPSQPQRMTFSQNDETLEVAYRPGGGGLAVEGRDDITVISMSPRRVEVQVAGARRSFDVARYGDVVCVDSALGPVTLTLMPRFADPALRAAAGSLLAPMPGTVSRVAVSPGDQVLAGQPLLYLEAMKMEHVISAPAAGIVADLPVSAGQQVQVGSVLAVVKPEDEVADERQAL
jgi:propionyl-CoA carboxylase alpha chain